MSNTGNVPVTITEINDDVYGDLANRSGSDCDEPIGERLAVGESEECSFTVVFLGSAGDRERDVVTVIGEDDDGREVSDSDEETIHITGGAPPPGAAGGETTIVVNNSSSSSSSSSAAAAGGGGGAPSAEQKVVLQQQAQKILSRTGLNSLPMLALSMALLVLGWLALAGHRVFRQRG